MKSKWQSKSEDLFQKRLRELRIVAKRSSRTFNSVVVIDFRHLGGIWDSDCLMALTEFEQAENSILVERYRVLFYEFFLGFLLSGWEKRGKDLRERGRKRGVQLTKKKEDREVEIQKVLNSNRHLPLHKWVSAAMKELHKQGVTDGFSRPVVAKVKKKMLTS